MKAHVYFLAGMLCSSAISAQTPNYAQHSGQRRTFNIESINNKSYYLVSDFQNGSCCLEKVKLIAHATNGNKLFESVIGQLGAINNAYTTVLANKTLLLQYSSNLYQCDVGGPRTVKAIRQARRRRDAGDGWRGQCPEGSSGRSGSRGRDGVTVRHSPGSLHE